MLLRSFALIAFAAIQLVGPTSSAQAGPLIDWLFGGRRQAPAYPVGAPIPLGNGYGVAPGTAAGYPGYPSYAGNVAGYPSSNYPGYSAAYPGYATGNYSASYAPFGMNAPTTGYAANLGTYYGSQLPVIGPSGAGYSAQMPTGIAAATMPQTMSYVPNFNSSALRVPVTYYRPLLTTDPNTGSQVVAMAPCTSYQYLTQRVPALGQSALYGTYQAPQPQPMQSIPSYTLPSGGIPLSSNSIGSSTFSGGTALGYSPYSTYQVSPPPMTGSPSYPTSPVGSNYYNSSPSGGSTGSIYAQPIPGLVAPPASTYSTPGVSPGFSQPGYTQPDYTQPGYSSPGLPSSPGSVMPPPSSSFGDTPPSLPPTESLKPRIQSIIPEASTSGAESALKSRTQERTLLSEPSREVPVLNPIPAPEGMEKPTWSPGLLRSEDMTALRPVTRSSHLAGQSKKIHWASFEQELTVPESRPAEQPRSFNSQPSQQATQSQTSRLQLQLSAEEPQAMTRLRPTPAAQPQYTQPLRMIEQPASSNQPTSSNRTQSSSVVSPAKRYDSNGWKPSR